MCKGPGDPRRTVCRMVSPMVLEEGPMAQVAARVVVLGWSVVPSLVVLCVPGAW